MDGQGAEVVAQVVEHDAEIRLSGLALLAECTEGGALDTTITVPAHGRPELSAKHTGMLIRELEKAGFDRHQIRQELGV